MKCKATLSQGHSTGCKNMSSSTNLFFQSKHDAPGLICQRCKLEEDGSVSYVALRQKVKSC